MHLAHSDSNGLFPGEFQQSLAVRGRRFELRAVPSASGAKPAVPDYYGNGEAVFVYQGGEIFEEPLDYPETTMPPWEVLGGLALSAALDSNAFKALAKTREREPKWEWRSPEAADWFGEPARKVQALQDDGEGTKRTVVTMYLHPSLDRLEGFSWPSGPAGKTGYARYRDQELGVPLPATLGDPP